MGNQGGDLNVSPVADKEDNAGMGLGHQEGDLNVSPVADKKDNAGMGGVAQTFGQCRNGVEGVEISTPSALYKEDNAGMRKFTRVEAQCVTRCRQTDKKDNAGMG
jgi:hypothetical protein